MILLRLLPLGILPLANACGVLTHIQTLQRATHLFAPTPTSLRDTAAHTFVLPHLLLHAGSFQAGAFFPDWGYNCLSSDVLAETAHWPPFLLAAVDHIHSLPNNTKEESEHVAALVSFVLGVVAHQVADTTWHAIRLPTGLLAALAATDFGGDVSKAHTNLDFGGDFLAAVRLARLEGEAEGRPSSTWEVPIDDVRAIYKRLGRTEVPEVWKMRYCVARGLAALHSEIAAGPALLPGFADRAPGLLDMIDEWHLGGRDEMAARTVGCWMELGQWLVDGVPVEERARGREGWGLCDVFQAVKARGGAGGMDHPKGWEMPDEMQRDVEMLTDGAYISEPNEFGSVQISLAAHITTSPPEQEEELGQQRLAESGWEEPTFLATYVPYAHLGASLAPVKWSFPDDPDGVALAVGAPWETTDSSMPGEGSVYVISSTALGSPSSSNFSISSEKYKKLSSSSRPDQRLGTALTALNALSLPLLAVSSPGPLTYTPNKPPTPPFTPSTAPAGRITLFTPTAAGGFRTVATIPLDPGELGSTGARWAGTSLLSFPLPPPSSSHLLLAAAPRSDRLRTHNGKPTTTTAEGGVYVYTLRTPDAAVVTEIPLPTPGHGYDLFGASMVRTPVSNTLFIGAPGANAVFAFQHDSASGRFVFTNTTLEATGSFGANIATGVCPDGREVLVIGAPNAGSRQTGSVYVYNSDGGGGWGLTAVLRPARPQAYEKFGRHVLVTRSQVVVGSGWARGERGAVWAVPLANVHGEVEVDPFLVGEELGAHLGDGLAVIPGNGGDGGERLIVGMPNAGVSATKEEMREFGAVAVLRWKGETGVSDEL